MNYDLNPYVNELLRLGFTLCSHEDVPLTGIFNELDEPKDLIFVKKLVMGEELTAHVWTNGGANAVCSNFGEFGEQTLYNDIPSLRRAVIYESQDRSKDPRFEVRADTWNPSELAAELNMLDRCGFKIIDVSIGAVTDDAILTNCRLPTVLVIAKRRRQ